MILQALDFCPRRKYESTNLDLRRLPQFLAGNGSLEELAGNDGKPDANLGRVEVLAQENSLKKEYDNINSF